MRIFQTTIIILVTLFSVSFSQQTSWQQVSPMPQGNLLDEISVVDANNIFACGANGTFMSSTNGGESWFVDNALNGNIAELFAVKFVNSTTGWVGGELGNIYKTSDAGRTWVSQNTNVQQDIFAISFAPSSSTIGWAVGGQGLILKTTNGGTTWTPQASNVSSSLFSVTFLSSAVGFAVGGSNFGSASGVVLKTTDGGTSWVTKLSGATPPIFGISFSDLNTGWIVDYGGNINRTTDGGTSWTEQPNDAGLSLSGVQFISGTTGWAAGALGTVLKTTNRGDTWVIQPVDTYKDLSSIAFADANTGWAVGDYGTIFKTTNGGTTWLRKSGVTKTDLWAGHFPSPQTGYFVGDEGTVLKTSDGGYTWVEKNTDSIDYSIYGVFFVSDNVGWAVGDYGLIFKTINGGTGWQTQSSGLEDIFQSVFFLDGSRGWICGDIGDMLRTTNGGATWIPETTNVGSYLEKVKFLNANLGWAVGDEGTIIKSTDGGVTWTQQDAGIGSANLYSLEIIDANNVYACGDYGLIIFTNNGGATWNTLPANDIISTFKDITVYNYQNIWAVGEDGLIYQTNNGGSNWTTYSNPTANTFWLVEAIPATSGVLLLAAGDGNTVFKSALGPLPQRKWNGTIDSLWTNASNWVPNGVPETYDSVYIPSSVSRRPTIRQSSQQINIASLTIGTNASLYVGGGLSSLVVSGLTTLDGKLEMETGARTDYFAGGGVVINNGSLVQANSPVTINGKGLLKGTFKDLVLTDSSSVSSAGNITITNTLQISSILQMRPNDTLSVTTTDTLAIRGFGIIEAGTVKRVIASGSTAEYRFESPATTVQFLPGGTTPSHVLMTSFPNTLAADKSPDIYVKRYYTAKAIGGSNYKAKIFLRFNEFETTLYPDEVGFFIDSLGLMINLGNSDYRDDDFMAAALDSISNFTTWYLGDVSYYPKAPLEFLGMFAVGDNGGIIDSIGFGSLKAATTGIDLEMGEQALDPKPGAGTYDIRWILPNTLASKYDYRPFVSSTNTENVFTCEFQPGPGGYPVQLSWNLESKADGMLFIRDAATQGTKLNVNMKTTSTVTITDPTITSVQIVQKYPFVISVIPSWNIVSMPVTPVTSNKKSYIFPTSISSMFGFRCGFGYSIIDSLENKKGYWTKFYSAHTLGLEGTPRLADTFTVGNCWNIIGSISAAVKTNNIVQSESGLVSGFYYSYNNGYIISDTIKPGNGYWVKCVKAGTLRLSSTVLAKENTASSMPDLKQFNRVIIGDKDHGNQSLYLGDEDALNVPIDMFELPPTSPAGVFDARFTSNRMFEPLSNGKTTTYTVSIQSEHYPVTVSCEGVGDIQYINVTDASTGTLLGTISTDGKSRVTINNSSVTKIGLVVKSGSALPKVYSLEQNYPNPFNPTTTVQFNLPEAATVTLQIFNILGQQVATLVDHSAFEPGSHFATWNASEFGSGVYFYRLVATRLDNNQVAYQQVKKLMLVK